MIDDGTVLPGDVLAIRTSGAGSMIIRLGEEIHGEAGLENHIAVMHHTDSAGVPWCIEGRPGGVGWRDARDYLVNAYTLTNRNQANRGKNGRQEICEVLEQMLEVGYDWPAIFEDAITDLHLPDLWASKSWGSTPPGHVVCSSLAAWAYHDVGWAHPIPMNHDLGQVQPSDWVNFILTNNFQ